VVSSRLIQILRTYCYALQPQQLNDLRAGIHSGSYSWFADEFAAAIRDRAFDRSAWEAVVGPSDLRETFRNADLVRAEQRIIWSKVVTDRKFPARRRDDA
jgi:hypothetical protein